MNKIEKVWFTEEGYKAVVRRFTIEDESKIDLIFIRPPMNDYRLGYVGVKEDHPLWGVETEQLFDLEVHGGVTYAQETRGNGYPSDGNYFWIGFDCAHLGDEHGRSLHYVFCRLVRRLW